MRGKVGGGKRLGTVESWAVDNANGIPWVCRDSDLKVSSAALGGAICGRGCCLHKDYLGGACPGLVRVLGAASAGIWDTCTHPHVAVVHTENRLMIRGTSTAHS
jgi:hypothetical protein